MKVFTKQDFIEFLDENLETEFHWSNCNYKDESPCVLTAFFKEKGIKFANSVSSTCSTYGDDGCAAKIDGLDCSISSLHEDGCSTGRNMLKRLDK